MKISGEEEKVLGIPVDETPTLFSCVAGPDEGAEELQLGVRRVPVRMAPVGQTRPASGGRARKKLKTNSGAAVGSGSESDQELARITVPPPEEEQHRIGFENRNQP
ncbi:hypothetical protein B0H14DRAFT_2594219 [Mycena olivaceomarginata]|nr:hypothetical protein B0H14DRAFT_2594219 [Mycena olivaceomarginata]